MATNNKPEIGLVAFENDLATLNETIYGAGNGNLSAAEIIACANESTAAPLVMTGSDAVIVGARLESGEDGQKLAKMLRDLKFSRNKKRNRALLGIVLWGNKAKEFSPLMPHPNVFVASHTDEEKLLRQRMGQFLLHTLPHIETAEPLARYEILATFLNQQQNGNSVAELSEAVANAVQKELKTAHTRISDLEDKISNLNNENFVLQKKNEEMQEAGKKLRQDYEELVKHLRFSCQETISELTGRADEIRALRQELDKSHQHFGLAVESLRSDIQSSNGNSVAHFRQELDEGNQQAWTTLLKVEQRRFTNLNQQLAETIHERNTFAQEAEAMRTALAETTEKYNDLAGNSVDPQEFEEIIVQVEEKMRVVQDERNWFESKVNTLEAECVTKDTQILRLTEERDLILNRAGTSSIKRGELEKELNEVRQTAQFNQAVESSLDALQQQIQTLEQQCRELRTERERKDYQIGELSEKLESAQRRASEETHRLTLALQEAQTAAILETTRISAEPEMPQFFLNKDSTPLPEPTVDELPEIDEEPEFELPELMLSVQASAATTESVPTPQFEVTPKSLGILTNDDLATMTLTALPRDLYLAGQPEKDEIDLVNLLKEVGDSVEPFLQGKPVRIFYEISSESRTLRTNRNKLRQIVFNLLTNAAVFTEEGQIVVQTDWMTDQTFSLSIIDSGVGIQPDKMETIFQKTGDGFASECSLPTTKEIVESLGGEIKARSWLGLGSLFVVRLPAIN